jgi:MoxR-like ATPase
LITIACHDDLTASDLIGRFLIRHDGTAWQDGPLTRAVRQGARYQRMLKDLKPSTRQRPW